MTFDGSNVLIFPNPNDLKNYNQNKLAIKEHSDLYLNTCYDLISSRYVDAIIQSGNHKNECRAMNDMVDRLDSTA